MQPRLGRVPAELGLLGDAVLAPAGNQYVEGPASPPARAGRSHQEQAIVTRVSRKRRGSHPSPASQQDHGRNLDTRAKRETPLDCLKVLPHSDKFEQVVSLNLRIAQGKKKKKKKK